MSHIVRHPYLYFIILGILGMGLDSFLPSSRPSYMFSLVMGNFFAADCTSMRTSSSDCGRPTGTNDPISGAIPAASRAEVKSTSALTMSIL